MNIDNKEKPMASVVRNMCLAGMLLLFGVCAAATSESNSAVIAPLPAVPYGANPPASGTFQHDGVTLYYETYGDGAPLLLVHGNGASIGTMAAQISHFKSRYKVIAMDSRDHGRSADSVTPLTYEAMADDLAALIDHLEVGSVDVVGWSDGGIEALLLGIRHPDKIKKVVAMAPNLTPGPSAFYKEVEDFIKASTAATADAANETPAGRRAHKVASLVLTEPNIDPKLLEQIEAPTLILAGDHDMVRLEHVVDIFNRLKNAQLGILPNSTHMVPFDNPELFNGVVENFLGAPFTKKDRVQDFVSSYEKLLISLPR